MPNLCRVDLLRVPWAPALSAVLRSIVDADVFVGASWCQQWAIPGQGRDQVSGILQDFDQKELLPTRREGKLRKKVKNSTRFLYFLMWQMVKWSTLQAVLEPWHFGLWTRHLMGRLAYGHPHTETQGTPPISLKYGNMKPISTQDRLWCMPNIWADKQNINNT